MKKSKYARTPQQIFKMSETQLNRYIKYGSKTVNVKYKSMVKSLGDLINFSEYITDFREITSILYGEERETISGATKNLTLEEKQETALAIARLSNITETPTDVKKAYKRNVQDIFKEPRYTRDFIDMISDERLIQLGRDNVDFGFSVLGSSRMQELIKEYGSDSVGFYRQMLIEISDRLDLYDEQEKEKLIMEEWTIPT